MFDRFKREREGGDGAVSAQSAMDDHERTRLHDREATAVRDRDAALRARETQDARGAGEPDGERRFAREDADRDGVDDRDERAGERRFTREDADHDGVDDRDERAARGTTARDGVRDDAGAAERDREHRPGRLHDLDRDGVDDRAERREHPRGRGTAAVVGADTMAAVRERQRERYGGFSWGSDFFGFLCALGLAAILTGILTGAGVAFGLFDQATGSDASSSSAQTIGLGGAIALLVVLALAWYAGGYVAGRMARFDGARQGVGVWIWTIVLIVVVAALVAIGGSKYDVLQSLNLPSIPVGEKTLTGAGAITGALALLTMLLFAVLGGKVGERFHRKVDRVAHDEDYAYAR
jgi:hypothetical protein